MYVAGVLLVASVLDVPGMLGMIIVIVVSNKFCMRSSKIDILRFLESSHADLAGLRIIYDGEDLFLNGYGRIMDILSRQSRLLSTPEFVELRKDISVLPSDVVIKNMTLDSLNMRGNPCSHGLVRIICADGKGTDMVMTRHPYQAMLKEGSEAIYFHKADNRSALVRDES